MSIATSGLRAQAGRMRVISENIANADSTAQTRAAIPTAARCRRFPRNSTARSMRKVVTLGRVRPDTSAFPRQVRAGQSGRRRQRQRQISQRQSADRNDRHARRAAVLRGEPQHHQRDAPDDPAHARYPQGLIGDLTHGIAHRCSQCLCEPRAHDGASAGAGKAPRPAARRSARCSRMRIGSVMEAGRKSDAQTVAMASARPM